MSRIAALPFLFCLAWGCPGQALAATLKIATIAPDGTAWMQALRAGAAEIEQRSAGRVKLVFYPGGVMGDDLGILRKIRIGQLQGGALTTLGLAQISPDTQVYGLPFLFRSFAEVDYVRQRMDGLLLEQIAQAGFIAFGITEGDFAYILSNSPISTPTELRAHKVWSPPGDDITQAGLAAIGVTPVTFPLTDVLTGLQSGLIDTVGNSAVGAIALQWHTGVKYLVDLPLFYLYGALVLERKAFARLTAEDQASVRAVLTQVFTRLNQQSRQDNINARRALQGQGIEFVTPAPEQDHWRAEVTAAMDDLSQRGAFSSIILTTLREHLAEYRRAHGN